MHSFVHHQQNYSCVLFSGVTILDMMELAFFWITWGVISFWALKTFYFSFSKEKIERLRKAVLGFHLAILILAFLPWLPPTLDNASGLTLALTGNLLAILFLLLIVLSVFLFLTREASLMKVAAGVTVVNTFVLFILMSSLRPTTFVLSFHDIAPILAILLLLICCIVGLLLWQKLQLREKGVKSKPPKLGRAFIFTGVAMLIVLGLILFHPRVDNRQEGINQVSQLVEVQDFKKAVEENGRSKFGIAVDRQDGTYSVIKVFESFPDHITTFNWYRVVSKTGKIERQDIATDTWSVVEY